MSLEFEHTEKKELSLEEAIIEVESIIKQMEASDVSLEDSFKLYQQGIEQLKACNGMLDTVEKQMLIIGQNGDLSEF